MLDPEVLRHVPEGRPFDFSKELFPLLLEMGRPLYGYVAGGYWQDIGNLDQFRQANFDALDEKVALNVAGIKLRGNVWVGEGVELADLESVEGPAFIGNYCRIAPQASVGPYSVLSPSVTLREHARTTRSVVDSSTYLGRSALVEGAIVGKSCDIRPHARLHEGVAVGRQLHDRRAERRHAGHPHLPVQGGRGRRPRRPEPDLGVEARLAPLRPRRGLGPRERRPDPGNGAP